MRYPIRREAHMIVIPALHRSVFLAVAVVLLAAGIARGADDAPLADRGAASHDSSGAVQPADAGNGSMEGDAYDGPDAEEEAMTIADPLEPFNRAMFVFNDRLYFWVLKPVSKGYGMVVPEGARAGVRNFFSNLKFPIRFFGCLLMADPRGAAIETGRFGINTTVGIAGFMDPASGSTFGLQKQDTDLGLALAWYGIGYGFYIDLPVLGPSCPRDTVGLTGDTFLDPVSYLRPWYAWLGVRTYEEVNATSLKIGDYESLKAAAIDPYVALRDAYVQYRQKQLKERVK
jgi:phospholipid-binding lipoprotein MlaA